jgi:cytochrome oxidase Cu insertion factor (SCO1/SenC/PrrC family)
MKRGPILALSAIIAVTLAWWALALWPLDGAPPWLTRAQSICFGTRPDGLPDAEGWTALVLQPAIMLGTLFVLWGGAVVESLRAALVSATGRVAVMLAVVALGLAGGLAGWRIADASEPAGAFEGRRVAAEAVRRVDRPAPVLGLVDQHGDAVTRDRFRGRSLLVTFAFGHCATVCPVIVRDLQQVRERLAGRAPAVVVITLDPWRDLPARLPSIARQWRLGDDEYVAGGSIERVNAVLDAWSVGRQRNRTTGDIVHPRLIYVVDGSGTVAFATDGAVETIIGLLERLR